MEPFKNFKNFILTQAAVATQSANDIVSKDKLKDDTSVKNIENLEPNLSNDIDSNRSSSVGERKQKFNIFTNRSIKLKGERKIAASLKHKVLLRSQSSTDNSYIKSTFNLDPLICFTNTNSSIQTDIISRDARANNSININSTQTKKSIRNLL
jgi:hypothetical protein